MIDLEDVAKDQTILTILNTTCMRKGKKELFNKYYKIGLERHQKQGNTLSFRILILTLFFKRIVYHMKLLLKRIICHIKNVSAVIFKKLFNKSPVTLTFQKQFAWDWDTPHFNRIALVNLLCATKLDGNYLEIGCQGNTLFDAVPMINKTGVDPTAGGTHRKFSDDFFKSNKTYFDVIFIDGLHVYDQVHRDVANAIRFLKPGGWVAMHDMLPLNAIQEHVPNISPGPWSGDVWKVAFELIASPGIDFKLIKIDCGVGLFKVNDPNASLKDFSEHLQNKRFQYLYENIGKLPLVELSEAYRWIRSNA